MDATVLNYFMRKSMRVADTQRYLWLQEKIITGCIAVSIASRGRCRFKPATGLLKGITALLQKNVTDAKTNARMWKRISVTNGLFDFTGDAI